MVALGTPSELARSLWQGVRLELETAPEAVAGALAVLQAFPDARDVVQLTSHPVLALALPVRDHVPQLVARLVAADVPLYRITPQEPTLEDVYFALHGSKEVQA
jgi:ABC-2 type transport system ATP-binding protein